MDETKKSGDATILVVDDNKNNLDLMLATLSEYDFRLLAATSGLRALKVVSRIKPDLILMDIQMPGMDGFETTRELKKNAELERVPVLFLSALNDLKNIVKCFEAGGVDYISKPFQKEELFARIFTHLKIKRLQTEVEEERDKVSTILDNILPKKYIRKLKSGSDPAPETIPDATVIFTDFENFAGLSKIMGPEKSVQALNEIFWAFDEIMQVYDLERVKTIGDAYMAVGGVNNAADNIELRSALAALKLQDFIKDYNSVNKTDKWKLRIGIHCGPIVTGIIGYQKIAFDVWGDTVNFASRLESAAKTEGIAVSEAFYEKLSDVLIIDEIKQSQLRNLGEAPICYCSSFNTDNEIAAKLYATMDTHVLANTHLKTDRLLYKIFDL